MRKLLQQLFRTGDATVKYPFAPFPLNPNFRGKPEFAPRRCIACAACTVACPANALTMETDPAAGRRTWRLNYGRCVMCARCEEVCPTGAIVLSGDFELAVARREDLLVTADFSLATCGGCAKPFAPAKEVSYVIALLSRSGLPSEEIERRSALYQLCPDCRRRADVPKVSETQLVRLAEMRP